MRALDTAALLAWPLKDLMEGICAKGQLEEIARHAPERALILENQGPLFESPSPEAIQSARNAATETGDLSGLAPVDLEILALAIERGVELVTDDYRLQNVCTHLNHPWTGVIQEGITESWSWILKCQGCGIEHPASSSKRKDDHGTCADCGANLRLKRQ